MKDNNILTDAKDDQLIASFFERYGKRDIADNGFSERVMNRLPDRESLSARRIGIVWTWVCGGAAIAAFLLAGGIKTTLTVIMNVLSSLAGAVSSINITPASVAIAYMTMLTLFAVAVYDIFAGGRRAGEILP